MYSQKIAVYLQKLFPENNRLRQLIWRIEFVWNMSVTWIQKTIVRMLEKIKFRGVNYCAAKEDDSEEAQVCVQLVKYCGKDKPLCKGHRAQRRVDCAAYHLTDIRFGEDWMKQIGELGVPMLEISETAFDELVKRFAYRNKYAIDYNDMPHRNWEEKLHVISDKHWRSNPITGRKQMKLATQTWEEVEAEINQLYRNEDEELLETQREAEQLEHEHFLAAGVENNAGDEEQADWDDGVAFPHHHYVHEIEEEEEVQGWDDEREEDEEMFEADADQEDNWWIGVMG